MDIPKVILKKDEEQRIKNGHPWVFSNEVLSIEGKIESGELCDVYSYDGSFIGRGFLNTASKIIVRMLSFEKIEISEEFFLKRIHLANEFRKHLGLYHNYRVVFSEADMLPGLIVDKYGDYLSVQFLSLGMDKNKQMIMNALVKIFSPKGIMERSDSPIRKKEGLEEYKGMIYNAPFNPKVVIEENGVQLMVDLENGQKTGYFLDQKFNRAVLKYYVKDQIVLDCFSHTGSFAMHALKYGATKSVAVDISPKACDDILINANLNHFTNIEVVCEDVFDFLRDNRNQNKFDVIILDPPAFTKSKGTIKKAYSGYKEINLSALKAIKSGGILLTFSCSNHMTPALFLQMLKEASLDSKRVVQMIDFRIQSPDHPVRIDSEESLYLKCVILRVL